MTITNWFDPVGILDKKSCKQYEVSGDVRYEFCFDIKRVIFNNPATIILWNDGTKTVVKCGNRDKFDPEKGLAMAIVKKMSGNAGRYYRIFTKWLPGEETEEEGTNEKAN